jgi:hypothetical protein
MYAHMIHSIPENVNELIDRLCETGAPRDRAEEALRCSGYNLERAAEILFTDGPGHDFLYDSMFRHADFRFPLDVMGRGRRDFGIRRRRIGPPDDETGPGQRRSAGPPDRNALAASEDPVQEWLAGRPERPAVPDGPAAQPRLPIPEPPPAPPREPVPAPELRAVFQLIRRSNPISDEELTVFGGQV